MEKFRAFITRVQASKWLLPAAAILLLLSLILAGQLTSLQKENAALADEILIAAQTAQTQEEEIARLTAENTFLAEQPYQLQQQITQLEENVKTYLAQMEEKEASISALNIELEAVKDELNTAKTNLEAEKAKNAAQASGGSGGSSSGSSSASISASGSNGSSSSSAMVYIPRTGSKYHSKSSCSNMKNPSYVTKSYAISNGYGQCSKCW